MNVTFEMFGERVLARELVGLGERLDGARPAHEEVMHMLVDIEGRQFDSAGAYGSGGWQPLAASTIQRKQQLGLNNGILIATGDLEQSLTMDTAPNAIREVTDEYLIFGSTVDHGIYHQLGKGVPRRRPMEIPEADRRDIPKVYQRWFFTGSVHV